MRVFALVFLLSSIVITTSYSVENADQKPMVKPVPFGPATKLIARDEGYLLHLIDGSMPIKNFRSVLEPGLSVTHTDIKTGEMKWLLHTGTFGEVSDISPRRRTTLLDLVQDETRLYVLTIEVRGEGIDADRLYYPASRYRLTIFRKSNGEYVHSTEFPARLMTRTDWPKETTEAGIIKKLENGIEVCGTVFEFTGDGKVIRKDAREEAKPTVLCTVTEPALHRMKNPHLTHAGFTFNVFHHLTGAGDPIPVIWIYSKEHQMEAKVERVSTKGGTFGRSPTIEECKAVDKEPPKAKWDFRGLADQEYVELPLRSGEFSCMPDKITVDEDTGEFVLHFNSEWGTEGVETTLRFKISDLEKAFDEAKRKESD